MKTISQNPRPDAAPAADPFEMLDRGIKETLATEDLDRWRSFLRGGNNFPAMGAGQEPWLLILQARGVDDADRQKIGEMSAGLLAREVVARGEDGDFSEVWPSEVRTWILLMVGPNAALCAALLAAEPVLVAWRDRGFFDELPTPIAARLERVFDQAIAVAQTDESLAGRWSVLADEAAKAADRDEAFELFHDAVRGALAMPADPEGVLGEIWQKICAWEKSPFSDAKKTASAVRHLRQMISGSRTGFL